MNAQTGASQPGKSRAKASNATSSGFGGCATTMPTSTSSATASAMMSVARRTRA